MYMNGVHYVYIMYTLCIHYVYIMYFLRCLRCFNGVTTVLKMYFTVSFPVNNYKSDVVLM